MIRSTSLRLRSGRQANFDATIEGSFPSLVTETQTWLRLVQGFGNSVSANSVAIADQLIRQIQAASYGTKVVWLVPLLGTGINAARVPLRDTLGVGPMSNVGFVDADFTEATGVKGNGTTKYFNTLIKPSQIGSSQNGGIGFWENNIDFTVNVEPMGCYDNTGATRFCLDFRSNVRAFRWGGPSNFGGDSSTATNGHYYGQRSSTTNRTLYKDGSQIGTTNSTSDGAANLGNRYLIVMGCDEGVTTIAPWKGRAACVYMTDGTLSSGDVTAFHALLNTYLITPTGR